MAATVMKNQIVYFGHEYDTYVFQKKENSDELEEVEKFDQIEYLSGD